MKSGFLIIDKPSGVSSFFVVATLRRITGVNKIGYAGTLDPLATGVLICAIGREATKKIGEFSATRKRYEAVLELGKTSDTYDADGQVKITEGVIRPTKSQIEGALQSFLGKIEQTPPAFSAKKINGKRAYALARLGREIPLTKSKVEIFTIEVVSYQYPFFKIDIRCGAGTYIRSIAHDLGSILETGAIVTALRRTAVGEIDTKKSIKLDDLHKNNWEKYLL